MKIDEKEFKIFYQTVLLLNNEEECKIFFEDLCTIKELHDFSQRLEVARRLDEGKNYSLITEETGASTATICRINKCLNYGSDGYRMILDRMKGEGQ